MKKRIVVILFSFFVINLIGQEITLGPEVELSPNSFPKDVIGYDSKFIYLLRAEASLKINMLNWSTDNKTHHNLFLDKYSRESLTPLYSKELVIPTNENMSFEYINIVLLNGKLILFTTYLNKKEMTTYLYAHPISEDGMVNSAHKEIMKFKASDDLNILGYGFYFSNDKQKLIVSLNYQSSNMPEKRVNKFSMIDDNLNTSWSKDIIYDRESELNYLKTKDDGLSLFQIYRNTNKADTESKNHFNYIRFYPETDKLTEEEFFLENIPSHSSNVIVRDNGDLIYAGLLYGKRTDETYGVFSIKIDLKTLKEKSRSIIYFDNAFLELYCTKREIEKGEGIEKFSIKKVITRENGDVIIVGEQSSWWSSTGSTSTNYNYSDIIIAKTSSDGKLSWAKIIPKDQTTLNDFGALSSFILVDKEKELHFIYFDNIDNLKLGDPVDGKEKHSFAYALDFLAKKKLIITDVVLTEDGKISRKKLTDYKSTEVFFYTKSSVLTNNMELFVFGAKMKRNKLMKINF